MLLMFFLRLSHIASTTSQRVHDAGCACVAASAPRFLLSDQDWHFFLFFMASLTLATAASTPWLGVKVGRRRAVG